MPLTFNQLHHCFTCCCWLWKCRQNRRKGAAARRGRGSGRGKEGSHFTKHVMSKHTTIYLSIYRCISHMYIYHHQQQVAAKCVRRLPKRFRRISMNCSWALNQIHNTHTHTHTHTYILNRNGQTTNNKQQQTTNKIAQFSFQLFVAAFN